MKWLIEKIMEQLDCDEDAARTVFSFMDAEFDGFYADLTAAEVRTLIADYANYVEFA